MRKTGAPAVLHTETQKGANARTYDRCENLTLEHDGVYVDYARQRVTEETMEKLYALAKGAA